MAADDEARNAAGAAHVQLPRVPPERHCQLAGLSSSALRALRGSSATRMTSSPGSPAAVWPVAPDYLQRVARELVIAVVVAHLLDQLLNPVDVAVRPARAQPGGAAVAQQRRPFAHRLSSSAPASPASSPASRRAPQFDTSIKPIAASKSSRTASDGGVGSARYRSATSAGLYDANVFVACMNASEGPHSANRKRERSALGGRGPIPAGTEQ